MSDDGIELDVGAGRKRSRPPADIDWALRLSVLAYGVRVGIRLNDPRLAELLMPRLPPTSKVEPFVEGGRAYSLLVDGDGARCSIFVDETPLVERVVPEIALRALQTDLQLHVAEMSPEHVFVHAGVVGWQGRAIVLPGRSFCGKTTLVAELVRAGAEYYSDEYAAIDAAGVVHPYLRPLSIRQPGGTRVESLPDGARADGGPLPIGLVLVSRFRAGAEWQPVSLSPGRGVLELLRNTVPARRIPQQVMSTLHRAVSPATVIRSDRGEASSVALTILDFATGLTRNAGV